MKPLSKIRKLGFKNSEVLSEDAEKTLIRVRTSNGWVYERFTNEDDVARWAEKHQPESK